MADLSLAHDVYRSNLPASEKSALARVLARVSGGSLAGRFKSHAVATGSIVMGAAESGVVGLAIGAAQAQFGPGVNVPFLKNADGTPMVTVPTELLAAGAGYAGAFAFPQEKVAPTLQRVGDIGVGVWAASKGRAWVAGLGSSSGAPSVSGDFGAEGVDRIVRLAKSIT